MAIESPRKPMRLLRNPSNNVSYRKAALTGKYLFAHRTRELQMPDTCRSLPEGTLALQLFAFVQFVSAIDLPTFTVE
ncbi:hypothetical protein EDD16DRAFT_1729311, partial [Pisolithus croceorrhizus]